MWTEIVLPAIQLHLKILQGVPRIQFALRKHSTSELIWYVSREITRCSLRAKNRNRQRSCLHLSRSIVEQISVIKQQWWHPVLHAVTLYQILSSFKFHTYVLGLLTFVSQINSFLDKVQSEMCSRMKWLEEENNWVNYFESHSAFGEILGTFFLICIRRYFICKKGPIDYL